MKKKILLGAALCLAALFLAAAGYAAYVILAYERLEDRLPLTVEGTASAEQAEVALGKSYRIASYNLGFGAYSADYSFFMDGGTESRARSPEAVRQNIAGALDALEPYDADFFLFQEVDVDGTRSHHIDEAALVTRWLGQSFDTVFAQNYDSPYLFWPLLEPHGANRAGQITASRFPITQAVRRSLPIEGGFMKFLDLDRCYSVCRVPVENGRELVLYHLHLSAYTSDGSIAGEQLDMLLADMQQEYEAGNYVVAGGDFNKDILGDSDRVFGNQPGAFTWAQPIPPGQIPPGFSLVAPFDPEDPVPSCRNANEAYDPDSSYVVTVDGFLVSDNVQLLDAQVIDTGFQWSDHNPVYLDFALKDGSALD